jgi:transcription initiation factor IIE alpha subunit
MANKKNIRHIKVSRKAKVANKASKVTKVKAIKKQRARPIISRISAPKQKVHEVKKLEKVSRTKVNMSIPTPEDAKIAIDNLLVDAKAIEYLTRNVSKRAVDVINMLGAPETDEGLAERLEMKINAVRRILNIMHGYGLTNYYVSKNINGWLSFSWYVNANKVPAFLEYIGAMGGERLTADENCNDYFVCNSCYKEDKFVYPFDAAYEAGFKCSCGDNLERVDRAAVETMLNGATESAAKE